MKYSQSKGEFRTDSGKLIGVGYAGNGEGLNNPKMEHVKSVGCLPKGKYTIGEPYDSPDTGKYTMALLPFRENIMHGRSGFAIHGDNKKKNKTASHGCIILGFAERVLINSNKDRILEVV